MSKYIFSKGYSARGANMGRPDVHDTFGEVTKISLQRVPLDRGGYDPGGAYWGHGDILYVAFGEGADEQCEVFFRAKTRAEAVVLAKKFFPQARGRI